MEQKHAGSWTMAVFFTGLMLLMAVLAPLVPALLLIGSFALVFYLPALVMQYGPALSLVLAATPVAVLGVLYSPAASLEWAVTGALGYAVGIGYWRRVPPLRILMAVCAGALVLAVGAVAAFWAANGIPIYEALQQAVGQVADAAMAYFKANNPGSAEILSVRQQIEEMKELVPMMIPVQSFLALVIMVYLQIRLTQIVLTRQGYDIQPFMPIRLWEIPRAMVYLYVLAMVMKYWGASRQIVWLNMMSVNLEQLASFFICIQGLAFILYLLHHRFVLRSSSQALLALMVMIIPMFQIGAFFFGLADMLLNYRKKKEAL